MRNFDEKVVADFGDEWERFDQSSVPSEELRKIFSHYFSIFPWGRLPPHAVGFDLGCGSGRWASFVAPRVGKLHCIDPAEQALRVARRNLVGHHNCEFHVATVDRMPIADTSMDIGYSLGVLHHVPDTLAGIRACVRKLKPGAPFLLYLYYAFDNRPWWFKAIWKLSDIARKIISILPPRPKAAITASIAVSIYWPLSRATLLFERLGMNVSSFPLAAYRDMSFYTLMTDARDRFGTRLEQRFTKQQISHMISAAGLEQIQFREGLPFWCAMGFKTETSVSAQG